MIKKIFWSILIVALIGVLIFGAVNRTLARSSDSEPAGQSGYSYGRGETASSGSAAGAVAQGSGSAGSGYGRGQGSGNSAAGDHITGDPLLENLPAPAELGADEAAGLLYMVEEEKLAHDLYVSFYAQWSLPVFQNISQSELAHIEAVNVLLDRYELTSPASSATGVFASADLQALYDDLIARGSQSLADALKVAASVEELDILDLESRIAQTDNADIQQVYTNLLAGSSNHLRSFASMLESRTAEIYQPQYLAPDAYQAILGSSAATGGSRGGSAAGGGYRGGRP